MLSLREWLPDPPNAASRSFGYGVPWSRRTSQMMPTPRSQPANSRDPSGENAITLARPSPDSIVRICSAVLLALFLCVEITNRLFRLAES